MRIGNIFSVADVKGALVNCKRCRLTDYERALAVIELLRSATRERQAAVLVVTHDDKIFGRLDKKVHLRDGWIVNE